MQPTFLHTDTPTSMMNTASWFFGYAYTQPHVIPVANCSVTKAEETLYRVNAHQLTHLSGVLRGMLTLAGPVNGDGLSDAKPIHLTETANEVDALFGWMTRIGWVTLPLPQCFLCLIPLFRVCRPPLRTVEAWIAVLKLATKYVIRLACEEAIERLDSFCIPAGQRLALGLAFSVPKWVEPAIRELVLAPVGSNSSYDLAFVRPDVLARITCLRERIVLHRGALLNNAEPILHDSTLCSGPQCGRLSWEMAWPNIMRLLFRPQNRNGAWWPGHRIYSVLEKTQFSDLTEACKKATLRSMLSRNVLGKESSIVSEGITSIVSYCDVSTPPEFQDEADSPVGTSTEP